MNEINYEIFIKNIGDLSKENNIPRNKALIESGVGKDFVTNITKGSAPSIDKIFKLSTYFNVSIDYLLGLDNVPNRTKEKNTLELKGVEKRVIEMFRNISEMDKGIIIGRLEQMLSEQMANELSQKGA